MMSVMPVSDDAEEEKGGESCRRHSEGGVAEGRAQDLS